jgi:AcrR family transcriptional regulator
MRRRHSRDEILEGALATALEVGLSQLTYGRVAKRLGINDRVVVYYFPSKEDLITEVLLAIGLQLQETLSPAFATPAADHLDLARRTWPLVATEQADPVFALFFEANGLAAAGRAPFDEVVPQLVELWVAWAADHLASPEPKRRTEATAAIALIDGLLLLRQLAGAAEADAAAARLGVR